MTEEKKYKFIVQPGMSHNQGTNDEANEGDVVEMTLFEALPFMDKFAPAGTIPRFKKILAEFKASKK